MIEAYKNYLGAIIDKLEVYGMSEYTGKSVHKHLGPLKRLHQYLKFNEKDAVRTWEQFIQIDKYLSKIYGSDKPEMYKSDKKTNATAIAMIMAETPKIGELARGDLRNVFHIHDAQQNLTEFHRDWVYEPLPNFMLSLERLNEVKAGYFFSIPMSALEETAPTEPLNVGRNISRGYYFEGEDRSEELAAEFLAMIDYTQVSLDRWSNSLGIDTTSVLRVQGETDMVVEDFEDVLRSELDRMGDIYLEMIYQRIAR